MVEHRPEDATHYEGRQAVGGEPKDPGRGKHLWIVTAAWYVDDPTRAADPSDQFILDKENLVSLAGPGCWKCEKEWTPGMERKWCNGTL